MGAGRGNQHEVEINEIAVLTRCEGQWCEKSLDPGKALNKFSFYASPCQDTVSTGSWHETVDRYLHHAAGTSLLLIAARFRFSLEQVLVGC